MILFMSYFLLWTFLFEQVLYAQQWGKVSNTLRRYYGMDSIQVSRKCRWKSISATLFSRGGIHNAYLIHTYHYLSLGLAKISQRNAWAICLQFFCYRGLIRFIVIYAVGRFRRRFWYGISFPNNVCNNNMKDKGALVVEACSKYPNLRGSVYDLPSALTFTHSSLLRQTTSSPLLMQRISTIPGDFFQDPLPNADIFALSRIIHDWPEKKAETLLRKVYEKLPPKGAVLICEMLLDEDGCGPPHTLLQSLSIFISNYPYAFIFLNNKDMLVQTGGRERRFSEYRLLLENVGFTNVRFKITERFLDTILAIK